MAANYVFTLQPTFTQGLIIGQLSILCLLYLVLKYLFLDSTERPFETLSYHPHVDTDLPAPKVVPPLHFKAGENDLESAEWLNLLLSQLSDMYRARLRNHISSPNGDEIARKRVEDYANRIRPAAFLDYIKVHAVDLGKSSPTLHDARMVQNVGSEPSDKIQFTLQYSDTLSMSLSTSYLFNYPMPSFARLPVSLTISLSLFRSEIHIIPPSSDSTPALTLSLSPQFTLDLTTTSLMGSRAKLANVPKLHELIEQQVRRVLASKGPWTIPLPNLASIPEIKEEIKEEFEAKLHGQFVEGQTRFPFSHAASVQ